MVFSVDADVSSTDVTLQGSELHTEFSQSQSQDKTTQGMSLSKLQSSTLLKYYKIENQVQELKGYIKINTDEFWLSSLSEASLKIQEVLQRFLSYHEQSHGVDTCSCCSGRCRNGTISSTSSRISDTSADMEQE
jgi:hypothetical protein